MPLVIGLAVFFWVAGFDIIYACQDADFDRQAKLHSIPAVFGVPAALRLARFSHLLMVVMLVVLYMIGAPPLSWAFLIGLGGVAALLTYEHAIVRPMTCRASIWHFSTSISLSASGCWRCCWWTSPSIAGCDFGVACCAGADTME